ncbi:TetR/AcrR family transcriptional regulator [Paenibacillus sp. FSL H8-0122]|uniref:TetR/AcrR family transcriptional regulator n=1 Tax=Paenibacillus sp. FSL H8-0122 TaxID=2954510 RepID=UPI0030F5E4EE
MMESKSLSTSDKLLTAAIDLFAEKGYKSVTTQEIAAAAGLSEKTLFRQFGTKLNLLERAFDRFHYTEDMAKLFNESIIWDLPTDLLLVSRTYHEIMNRNRKMNMIFIKEGDQLPGLKEYSRTAPEQLMRNLTDYFKTMTERGKLIPGNPRVQAVQFMVMNYGAFLNNLDDEGNFTSVSLEEFITASVQTFTRALTP